MLQLHCSSQALKKKVNVENKYLSLQPKIQIYESIRNRFHFKSRLI